MKNALVDIAGLTGFCLTGYGSWLIYEPAGFIVGGLMLVAFAIKAETK